MFFQLLLFSTLLNSILTNYDYSDNGTESPEFELTTYPTEYGVPPLRDIFRYDGVYCHDCDETYYSVCPLHVTKHVKDRTVAYSRDHNRAEKTAPAKILKLEESSIPGAGGGIWTVKKIPKGVVFGPLEGKIIELEDNTTIDDMFWKIPGTNETYISLMDKTKANYMAFINCARNIQEENLIKVFNTTTKQFYFISKSVIPKYSELLIDYGTDFRKTIGISDLDYSRPKLMKRKVFPCDKCMQASYTPVNLLPNHHCPTPTNKQDPWIKVLKNTSIVKKEVLHREEENYNAYKVVYDCNICGDKGNRSRTSKLSQKAMKNHFYTKHEPVTGIKLKTLIRDDFTELNKKCYRYYKCNICANESAGLNWTIKPFPSKDSIEFEQWKGILDNFDIGKYTDVMDAIEIMNQKELDEDQTKTTSPPTRASLTPLGFEETTIGITTRKKYKINKKYYFKDRDDAECHFKKLHHKLVNATDIRIMKYKADPHDCSLCGNETIREYFGIEHHIDFHLNLTEMFDRGILQLDYRTKKFNEPYIENFNFSHLFCHKCNSFIDNDKNHEPEREEIMAHVLDHINVDMLAHQKHVTKRKVIIGNRNPIRQLDQTILKCQNCSFGSDDRRQMIYHIMNGHDINPYEDIKNIPHSLKDDPLKLIKKNTTIPFEDVDLESNSLYYNA